jgi:hypothetical protein
MDPITIGLIVGLATLIVERISLIVYNRVKKSECLGIKIEMKDSSNNSGAGK